MSGQTCAATECVYVSNLPHDAVGAHVQAAFEAQGIGVARIEILKKGAPSRRRGSGLAVVALESAGDARRSCELLDGKPLLGRPMLVRHDRFEEDDPAYRPPEPAARPGVTGVGS